MRFLLDEMLPSNRLADLTPLVPNTEAALSKARPGEAIRVARYTLEEYPYTLEE